MTKRGTGRRLLAFVPRGPGVRLLVDRREEPEQEYATRAGGRSQGRLPFEDRSAVLAGNHVVTATTIWGNEKPVATRFQAFHAPAPPWVRAGGSS